MKQRSLSGHTKMILLYKWMCLLMSSVFIMNSGCYSYKIANSIEKENVVAYSEANSFKPGVFIRVHLEKRSSGSPKFREGQISRISHTELIIKYGGDSHAIPFDQIVKIDLLDKDLNVVKTIIFIGVGTVILYYVGSLIIIHSIGLDTL